MAISSWGSRVFAEHDGVTKEVDRGSPMFPMEAFQRTLGKATDIFRQLGIPYHLTGGVAAVYYTESRLTQDSDRCETRQGTSNLG